MKKLFFFAFSIFILSLIPYTSYAQIYGVCVWSKYGEKIIYISYIFEYKEDSWTSNTALKCSITNALKIQAGNIYKDYSTKFYLRNDRNMFYPYTEDEAIKLRSKLISEFREKDYSCQLNCELRSRCM